jgi:hypothetical protein
MVRLVTAVLVLACLAFGLSGPHAPSPNPPAAQPTDPSRAPHDPEIDTPCPNTDSIPVALR